VRRCGWCNDLRGDEPAHVQACEVKWLRSALATADDQIKRIESCLEETQQVVAQLVLQRAELVAALEWYADGDHYGDEDEDGRVPIEWDWGERAREALRRVRG
jgi:hypothetical protein